MTSPDSFREILFLSNVYKIDHIYLLVYTISHSTLNITTQWHKKNSGLEKQTWLKKNVWDVKDYFVYTWYWKIKRKLPNVKFLVLFKK